VYEGTDCAPPEPMPIPATEAVAITREGSAVVAFFSRRGANLVDVVVTCQLCETWGGGRGDSK